MRVSMSPRGSVIVMVGPPFLPARLDHARNLAGRSEFTERDPREFEFAIDRARTSGQLTTIADARRRRVARHLGELQPGGETLLLIHVHVVGDRLQTRALG